MNLDKVLELVTPEVYQKFKQAVALRKWPDGKAVSNDQMEICMQAIIAYEHANVPEEERTGYLPPKSGCETHQNDAESTLKWK